MDFGRTLPSIRHPSAGWGPALAARQRDASLRWHDGVGRKHCGLDGIASNGAFDTKRGGDLK